MSDHWSVNSMLSALLCMHTLCSAGFLCAHLYAAGFFNGRPVLCGPDLQVVDVLLMLPCFCLALPELYPRDRILLPSGRAGASLIRLSHHIAPCSSSLQPLFSEPMNVSCACVRAFTPWASHLPLAPPLIPCCSVALRSERGYSSWFLTQSQSCGPCCSWSS